MRAMRAQLLADGRHLNTSLCNAVKRRRDALDALAAQLELLNPQRTLERGYAIVRNVKGEVLRDPAQVKARNKLSVRLAGGTADIVVSSVQAAPGDPND
jgi:exodeoxyribonuclease VII large subunit